MVNWPSQNLVLRWPSWDVYPALRLFWLDDPRNRSHQISCQLELDLLWNLSVCGHLPDSIPLSRHDLDLQGPLLSKQQKTSILPNRNDRHCYLPANLRLGYASEQQRFLRSLSWAVYYEKVWQDPDQHQFTAWGLQKESWQEVLLSCAADRLFGCCCDQHLFRRIVETEVLVLSRRKDLQRLHRQVHDVRLRVHQHVCLLHRLRILPAPLLHRICDQVEGDVTGYSSWYNS